MTEVGVDEAKTRLPELLDQVAKGRRITITRHGHPIAVLIPAARGAAPRGGRGDRGVEDIQSRPAFARDLSAGDDRQGAAVSRFVLDCSVTMAWCLADQFDR